MTFSKNRLNLITAHHINDHLHSINWLHNYRSMSRSGRWEGRGQEWGHDQGGKCGQLNHTSIIVGNFRANPNPYTGGGRSRQSVKPSKPGGARQLANAKTADARARRRGIIARRPQQPNPGGNGRKMPIPQCPQAPSSRTQNHARPISQPYPPGGIGALHLPPPLSPSPSSPTTCHCPLHSTVAESPMPMRASEIIIIGRTPPIPPPPPSSWLASRTSPPPPLGLSASAPPPLSASFSAPPRRRKDPTPARRLLRCLSYRGTSSPPRYLFRRLVASAAPSVAAQWSSSDPRAARRSAPLLVRPRAAIALLAAAGVPGSLLCVGTYIQGLSLVWIRQRQAGVLHAPDWSGIP
jgi:hypothetical protein